MNTKEVRARLELDQQGFADLMEVSIWTVRSWDQKIRNPSTSHIKKMTKLFNSAYQCQHCNGGLCKSVCADEDLTNKEK